jgi:hypothetical protein
MRVVVAATPDGSAQREHRKEQCSFAVVLAGGDAVVDVAGVGSQTAADSNVAGPDFAARLGYTDYSQD